MDDARADTRSPGSHGITVAAAVSFVDLATDALMAAREEIDALNVYPVPDGDTGTNMFLTVSAARDALRDAVAQDRDLHIEAALPLMARAALLGARGNSGVILSQMLGAFTRRVRAAAPDERRAQVIAEAMASATEASYAAVGTPVEGTILSVARAASDAALATVAGNAGRTGEIWSAAAAAAREALLRTPEQLPVLAQAGVVDAGGRGLCVVLDAVETASTGRRHEPPPATMGHHQIPIVSLPADDLSPDGPSYEVMYLLDANEADVDVLRGELASLGDSLVVVGGERLWNVHVHVDDVGAAIEAGIAAGRPYRIRVTHFADQVDAHRAGSTDPSGRRVVAVTAGPGLAALFESAGALVLPGGPGQRPSAGEILDAITGSGAVEIVVLPNDPDTVRAAEIAAGTAAQEHGLQVEVIATQAQVQGLAAMAVHEPARTFDADVREMTATARHARHGAVTIAARTAITMAGPCEPGDALGVIAGDFAIVGSDLDAVAVEVVERLLGGGGELVTIVSGEDGVELAARTAAYVEETHAHVDLMVHHGGQGRYPLLMSVE